MDSSPQAPAAPSQGSPKLGPRPIKSPASPSRVPLSSASAMRRGSCSGAHSPARAAPSSAPRSFSGSHHQNAANAHAPAPPSVTAAPGFPSLAPNTLCSPARTLLPSSPHGTLAPPPPPPEPAGSGSSTLRRRSSSPVCRARALMDFSRTPSKENAGSKRPTQTHTHTHIDPHSASTPPRSFPPVAASGRSTPQCYSEGQEPRGGGPAAGMRQEALGGTRSIRPASPARSLEAAFCRSFRLPQREAPLPSSGRSQARQPGEVAAFSGTSALSPSWSAPGRGEVAHQQPLQHDRGAGTCTPGTCAAAEDACPVGEAPGYSNIFLPPSAALHVAVRGDEDPEKQQSLELVLHCRDLDTASTTPEGEGTEPASASLSTFSGAGSLSSRRPSLQAPASAAGKEGDEWEPVSGQIPTQEASTHADGVAGGGRSEGCSTTGKAPLSSLSRRAAPQGPVTLQQHCSTVPCGVRPPEQCHQKGLGVTASQESSAGFERDTALLAEYRGLRALSPPGVYLQPDRKNMLQWQGVIFVRHCYDDEDPFWAGSSEQQQGSAPGAEHWLSELEFQESLYGGGVFRFILQFPDTFPSGKPSIRFVTPVFHPLVSEADGLLDLSAVAPEGPHQRTSVVRLLRNLLGIFSTRHLLTLQSTLPAVGQRGEELVQAVFNGRALDLLRNEGRAFQEEVQKCVANSVLVSNSAATATHGMFGGCQPREILSSCKCHHNDNISASSREKGAQESLALVLEGRQGDGIWRELEKAGSITA